MNLTQQFIEPHAWWDYHEAQREEHYRKLIDGKSCLDCDMCRTSDRFPCGFCIEDGEMRYADDIPAELGFDCFRGAA